MSKKKSNNKVDINVFGINLSANLDEVIGNFCNLDTYTQKVTEVQKKAIESKDYENNDEDCEE
jgi:hypothetical protein